MIGRSASLCAGLVFALALGSARADAEPQGLPGLDAAALQRVVAQLASPSPDATRGALTLFRRATGSKSAEDEVDIAAGVLPVLQRDRSAVVVQTAEIVLYV